MYYSHQIAIRCGIEASVLYSLLHHLSHTSPTVVYDNKSWMRITHACISQYLPFLTAWQIRKAIKALHDTGFISTRNHIPNFSTTTWITILQTPEDLFHINPSTQHPDNQELVYNTTTCVLHNPLCNTQVPDNQHITSQQDKNIAIESENTSQDADNQLVTSDSAFITLNNEDKKHIKHILSFSKKISQWLHKKNSDYIKELLHNNNNEKLSSLLPSYIRFMEYIQNNAPRILKMKEPFTIHQYTLIINNIRDKQTISSLLLNMQNWQPLIKKNTSAYLTLLNWHKRST